MGELFKKLILTFYGHLCNLLASLRSFCNEKATKTFSFVAFFVEGSDHSEA
jgi:hypothetical protein